MDTRETWHAQSLGVFAGGMRVEARGIDRSTLLWIRSPEEAARPIFCLSLAAWSRPISNFLRCRLGLRKRKTETSSESPWDKAETGVLGTIAPKVSGAARKGTVFSFSSIDSNCVENLKLIVSAGALFESYQARVQKSAGQERDLSGKDAGVVGGPGRIRTYNQQIMSLLL